MHFFQRERKIGLNEKPPHQKQEFIHEENRKGVWEKKEK